MFDQAVQDYLAASSPYSLVGLMPTGNKEFSGSTPYETLGVTSNSAGDQGANAFHPDSPVFWVVAILGATLLGIFGVSAGVKAGPVKSSLEVGKV